MSLIPSESYSFPDHFMRTVTPSPKPTNEEPEAPVRKIPFQPTLKPKFRWNMRASAMDPAPVANNDAEEPSNEALDRKSTRLNSSHMSISYAVFCLKKKKKKIANQ